MFRKRLGERTVLSDVGYRIGVANSSRINRPAMVASSSSTFELFVSERLNRGAISPMSIMSWPANGQATEFAAIVGGSELS